MAIVFLDTNIALWGILHQAHPDQQSMIPKAKYLLTQLDKAHDDVYITSITLAELLCGIPRKKQAKVREAIQRRIRVIPFDALAAKYYGEIYRSRHADGTFDFLKQHTEILRKEFSADCMILGTALSRNGTVLYTHDPKFKKIASGFISVPELPTIPPQMIPLPIDKSQKKGKETEDSVGASSE